MQEELLIPFSKSPRPNLPVVPADSNPTCIRRLTGILSSLGHCSNLSWARGEGMLPFLLPLTQSSWSDPLGGGGGGGEESNYNTSLVKILQWLPIVVRITFQFPTTAFQALREPTLGEVLQHPSLPAVLPHLHQLRTHWPSPCSWSTPNLLLSPNLCTGRFVLQVLQSWIFPFIQLKITYSDSFHNQST